MEIEYELTPDDLYAFQWRAVFLSPRGRRVRRTVYLLWVLAGEHASRWTRQTSPLL